MAKKLVDEKQQAIIEYLERGGINDLRDEIYAQQNLDMYIVKELEVPDAITAEQVIELFNDHGIEIGADCGTMTIYFDVKKAAESILQIWRESLLSDLILGSARGVYIPQNFAEGYQDYIINKEQYKEEIEKLLEGPDNEFYWDSWIRILDNVKLSNGSKVYSLYDSENNDIFLVDESITSESFFGLDEEVEK